MDTTNSKPKKKKKDESKKLHWFTQAKSKEKQWAKTKKNGMESPESKCEIIFIMFVISDELTQKKTLAKKN